MPGAVDPAIFQTRGGKPLGNSTRAFFASKGKQLYFVQVARTAYYNPMPIGYQFASDRIAPKPFAPIYEAAHKYTFRAMPLEKYEQHAAWLRRHQMTFAKAEAAANKRYEATEALLTLAAIMVAPYAALGELLVVEKLIAAAQFLNHVLRAGHGDQAAWGDVMEDVFDHLCSQYEYVLPSWARIAVAMKPHAQTAYQAGRECFTRETTPGKVLGTKPPLRVPADEILEQCYRFRCMMDPSWPAQLRLQGPIQQSIVEQFKARQHI